MPRAWLDPLLDPLAVRATRALLARLGDLPLRAQAAEERELALARVRARFVPAARALAPEVLARDERAIAGFDALVARAVGELRSEAGAAAAQTPAQRAAHALDRVVYADRGERLDDPSFDERRRARALDRRDRLERLDRLNEALGAYDAFESIVAPLVEASRRGGRAPVVVDLASGHAGFAVELALRLGAREGRARVVATAPRDAHLDAYLDVGRARAAALAMSKDAIDFFAQDALDLRELALTVGAPVDVVVCTQTLHRFAPGVVARLLAEATRTARVGAVLIDAERHPVALVGVALLAAAVGRAGVPFVHDAVVSMRRTYTEQELALIAQLAPGADGLEIERGWSRPGHVWLRARRRGRALDDAARGC